MTHNRESGQERILRFLNSHREFIEDAYARSSLTDEKLERLGRLNPAVELLGMAKEAIEILNYISIKNPKLIEKAAAKQVEWPMMWTPLAGERARREGACKEALKISVASKLKPNLQQNALLVVAIHAVNWAASHGETDGDPACMFYHPRKVFKARLSRMKPFSKETWKSWEALISDYLDLLHGPPQRRFELLPHPLRKDIQFAGYVGCHEQCLNWLRSSNGLTKASEKKSTHHQRQHHQINWLMSEGNPHPDARAVFETTDRSKGAKKYLTSHSAKWNLVRAEILRRVKGLAG